MGENVGIVSEILLDKYVITSEGKKIVAVARGNVKKNGGILVGDKVKFKSEPYYVIESVEKRKNKLIRPPVANIDSLVIVLCVKEPEPDYILLDKQIVFCLKNNIEPIICVNKVDIEDENNVVEYIKKVYGNMGIKFVCVSAKEERGIDNLKNLISGKISAFSGNSGVGKSSITSVLVGSDKTDIQIGDMTKNSSRGKHTTKYVKLYEVFDNTYILDTPGFSSYELEVFDYKNLKEFYKDFLSFKCEYDDCMHVLETEDVCGIKNAVRLGKFDKDRYDRYVYIFNKLKELYEKRYK